MNDHKQTEFKVGVPRLFSVQEGQNLVTLYRSCESESYNNVKTRHLPKRMRFTVTYALRNYICGLERNEGFLFVLQKLIKLLDIPDMTDSEVESINKQQVLIHNHRISNQKLIAKRNAVRADHLDEISKRHAFFDLGQSMVLYKNPLKENGDKSLLEYGKSYQEDHIYIPTTVLDDPVRTAQIKEFGKCVSCDLGVKIHHNKCRICHFQSLPSSTLDECQLILQDAFYMESFRDGQYEMCKAFVDGQSVIARKKTSYGKSFIHTFLALTTPGTIFIV